MTVQFDWLLTGATLVPLAPATDAAAPAFIRAGVIGFRDSRITWMSEHKPEAYVATRELDLSGHVITPGFINVHLHGALTMVRGVAADLGFAPSYTRGIPAAHDLLPEEAAVFAQLGAVECLLAGSTLIGDHFVHEDAALPAMAALGMRVHASHRLHDVDFARVSRGIWEYDARLGRVLLDANLALYERWHGKHGGRVAVQFAAHAPDTCSRAFLREIERAASKRSVRVNTHLAQSKVEVDRVRDREGCSGAELLEDVGLLNERLIAGHCIFVTADDITRIARTGAHVCHIPKCNAASGRMAPTPQLRAAGANLTLASDTQHGDMIEVARWALATARMQLGRVDDQWQPRDVLTMATGNGAAALGLADELGSLTVGKRADVVVWDFRRPHLVPNINPLGNLVHTAQGRDVAKVFVDGELVVDDGRPTKVDLDAILTAAERASHALWKRVAH